MSNTHIPVAGSTRSVLPGAQILGRANAHATITVTLKLRRQKNLPELNGRPQETMDRKTLAAYGSSAEDIQKVISVLEGKYGLKAVETHPETRSVKFTGTVAAMENAFEVKLMNYAHPDGNYRGRVGNVHIPVELQEIVQGVFGLDNRRVAHRARRTTGALHAAAFASAPSSWYTSKQLAGHYNFPAGDGTGQTVAILEFGGGYFPSDLAAYCQMAGVNVPTVKAISTDGTPTSAHDGAEGEVMLDVEVVAGVCPKAHIVLYFAHFTEQGWISNLDAVVARRG